MNFKIARGFLRTNKALLISFTVVLFLLTSTAETLLACHDTLKQVDLSDMYSRRFWHSEGYGSTTQKAYDLLRDLDDEADDVTPMSRDWVTIDTGSRSLPTNTIVAGGDLHYGFILTGAYPTKPGEAVISKAVADQLFLDIGDTFSVRDTTFTVSGIGVTPASYSELYVFLRSTPAAIAENTSEWITDRNLESDPRFSDYIHTGAIRSVSMSEIIYRAPERVGTTLTLFKLAAYALYAGLVAAYVAALSMLRRRSGPLRAALDAAGMGRLKAAMLTDGAAIAGLLISTLIGALTTPLLYAAFGQRIGLLFNQLWTPETAHFTRSPYIATLIALILAFSLHKSAILARRIRHTRQHSLPPIRTRLLFVFATAVTIAGIAASILDYYSVIQDPYIGLILTPVGATLLCYLASWRWCDKPLRTAGYITGRGAAVLGAVAAASAALAAFTSSSLITLAVSQAYGHPNDEGRITVGFLSQDDIDLLYRQFPDIMSEAIVFTLPDESDGLVRLGNETWRECAETRAPTCPGGWATLIGFISPQSTGSDLIGKVSPEVSSYSDDGFALLLRDGRTSSQTISSNRIKVGATTDDRLDYGNLPGAVFATNDETLQELGITPGVDRRLYIPNLNDYAPEAQRYFRQVATSLSADVAVTESTTASVNEQHTIAYSMLIAISLVAMCLNGVAMVVVRKSSDSLTSTLHNYAASKPLLRRIRISHVLPGAVGIILGAIVGQLTVTPGLNGRTGEPVSVPTGHMWWLLPTIIAVTIVGCAVFLPYRADETPAAE